MEPSPLKNSTEMDQNLFDCVEFEEPLTTIPALHYYSDQVANALVPLPASFDDHFSNQFLDISMQALPLVPDNYYDYTPLPPMSLVSFDGHDINLDSLSWDYNINSVPQDAIIDAVPLNTASDDSMLAICEAPNIIPNYCNNNIEDDHHRYYGQIERRVIGRSKLGEIGLEEMKSYFYMPITRAAKEMNVGVTLLKKRCRELGIPRWPHRKMKSLTNLIHNVQELGKGSNEECIRRELETLEEQRRLMEENPDLQLTERAKILRQACFKANYKRRRCREMQRSYFDP